ncbi:PHD finger protein, partial [Cucurbita argyrosperma subsp. argyrosperma]
MKGQSNRLQSMDPPDDWVNGSWTVDCICGVNFDDGEEMVNCDECGVWVHTRCSRYVKGDDIFVCDKCKRKNERNDCEETEVAQLLVELPTKTMSMESTYVCNGPSQRPFRLWTDIPIEERVHVHGVPGGDPALFSGLSSLFTPQLWNCTGYVPKKFNFQYREFPCWDEDQSDNTDNGKNENPADKGAGVLFSLSKDNVLATPVAALIGVRSKSGDVLCDRNGLLSEKHGVSEDLDRYPDNGVRERSFLRPLLHSGKCKTEDYLVSKDQSGKMKSTPSDKVTNLKKRIDHASKIDRDQKHARGNSENPRNKSSREMVDRELSNAYHVANKNNDNHRDSCELSPGVVSSEISKNNSAIAIGPKDENGVQVSLTVENSAKIEDDGPPLFAKKDVGNIVVKQGGGTALDHSDDGGFSRTIVKPSVGSLGSTKLESKDDKIHDDVNCGNSIDSSHTDAKFKIDKQLDVSGGALNFQASAHSDATEMQKCNDRMPESNKVNSGGVSCGLQVGSHKAEKSFEGASNYHLEKADEQRSNPCVFKQEWDCPEGSTTVHINSLKPQNVSEFGDEKPSKSSGMALHQHVLPSQHKATLCVGKSSPASSNVIISKPSMSNDLTPEDPENLEGTAAKHEAVSGSCGGSRKEYSSNGVDRVEERDKLPRRRIKEQHPKECLNAAANSLYSVRDLQDPISKRNTLHVKDSVVLSTVKTPLAHNAPDSPGYSESIESHLNHKGLTSHNKVSSSCLPQRGDKPNHPPSKVNQRHATAMCPPATTNPPAVLSDEELAFLLHQELNSSPRVPRVPRLRQTGSSPQLGSSNATSLLIKRSSSRGRDYASASRMKNRDALRDTFRSSREPDDDVKRTDEILSSPDQRRQETSNPAEASKKEESGSPTRLNAHKRGLLSTYATNTASNSAEASKREENGSPSRLNALKKGLLSAYATNTASSGPSSSMEANDHNNSSIHHSPRNTSDDDTGTVGEGPVHPTLPGLINEIMSQGRRMTYEELCNAVLPHWHNLRKHNGERYAYSSHSQAVLDCLRNRHEWARLVDRGPKTNSSRKRRKFDVEESEDSEYGKGRPVKVAENKGLESHKEEFPKRKRNTRKRRLALQGKGIKDIRKRRKTEMFTDDDVGLLSDSSDGSMFSEDELQDVDECSERREGSGSDE